MNWKREGHLLVPDTKPDPATNAVAIDPPDVCPLCGNSFTFHIDGGMTCVGYYSPPGHNHDDNCHTQIFVCTNGHRVQGSVQRRCGAEGCKWIGKVVCCGYNGGPKWTRWPKVDI